jgi:anthranilate 1,2-dioxygenase small subunit
MSLPAEILLRLEMQDLQDRYMAAIDNDKLEEWPSFFVEDCLYEIIPKENADAGLPIPLVYCDNAAMLRDRVISLRHANIFAQPCYRHFLSGLSCRMAGDGRVEISASYLVINTTTAGESQVYQAGRYEDVVVRTESGWRFKSKRAIYDTSRVQTLLAYPI